ncbi:MAG: hypothetical protein HF962_00495 [Sulfurovum sp.]|nr:hypothetical protein [Sulfurovum sp.]
MNTTRTGVPTTVQTGAIGGMSLPPPKINTDFLGMNANTWKGIGTIAGVLGSIWGQSQQAKYQKKLFKEEKRRVDREEKRQEKFERDMAKAYA